jgi:deoxyadenosine/deoxycytidine kinase
MIQPSFSSQVIGGGVGAGAGTTAGAVPGAVVVAHALMTRQEAHNARHKTPHRPARNVLLPEPLRLVITKRRMIACRNGPTPAMPFQYIAIEGPIGAGKSSLAERLATRLDATAVLEETENPFLADFYAGRAGAALQAQLFYLLNRHRQQLTLQQADLFSQSTISDYLFDRDKIFAYLNLDDNELFIYQRLFDLLSKDVPAPDLVVYLQAPTDVLTARLRDRAKNPEHDRLIPGDDYIRELNEAYQHFFFHYAATPLLVVETSQMNLQSSDEALDDLIRQIRTMKRGTRYYVPRTK